MSVLNLSRKPKQSALATKIDAIRLETVHAVGLRSAGEDLLLRAGDIIEQNKSDLRGLANERELDAQLATEDAASLRHLANNLSTADSDVDATFALAG